MLRYQQQRLHPGLPFLGIALAASGNASLVPLNVM
jgi:hypothetical protein